MDDQGEFNEDFLGPWSRHTADKSEQEEVLLELRELEERSDEVFKKMMVVLLILFVIIYTVYLLVPGPLYQPWKAHSKVSLGKQRILGSCLLLGLVLTCFRILRPQSRYGVGGGTPLAELPILEILLSGLIAHIGPGWCAELTFWLAPVILMILIRLGQRWIRAIEQDLGELQKMKFGAKGA